MSEWNDRTIETLRVHWADGHSTAEIGRRMGISKNAVVGKAKRLGLPARPSPIHRSETPPPPPPPPRVGKRATLPSLGVPAVVLPLTRLNNQGRRVTATYGGTSPIRTPLQGATLASITPRPMQAMPVSPTLKCQWIEAERPRCATPAQYEAAFCGKPTLIRRNEFGADKPCSYCPEHAGRAFTRHVSLGYAEPKAA